MDVKLTDVDLRAAIERAFVASLTADARERLIADALRWLTEPRKQEYRSGPPSSPLADAFHDALARVAAQFFADDLARPDSPVRVAVRGMVDEAVARLVEGGPDRSGFVRRMVEGIEKAFNPY